MENRTRFEPSGFHS